ncbi:MAG: PQQ-dependent sugar dehydrogenase, partial [Arenimonas sp.]
MLIHHPAPCKRKASVHRNLLLLACSAALACSCRAQDSATAEAARPRDALVASPIQGATSAIEPVFAITEVASFQSPWALAFLPDGRMLVTEKRGVLKLVQPGGTIGEVSGVPKVDYGGQGGLGDVVLHPKFADNGLIYLSYVEAGDGNTRGAAVARAKLSLDAHGGGALSDLQVIWRQQPKVDG